MDSETKLTARLVKCWRQMKGRVLNVHGNAFQESGWPDVFVSHKLWTGWIEFKGRKTVIKSVQLTMIQDLERTMPAYIVRFLAQDGNHWQYSIMDSNQRSLKVVTTVGTDGEVAAQMLHSLKNLEI